MDNRILAIFIVAILVLAGLNLKQCSDGRGVKDAELDAVALERIQQAWDAFNDSEKLLGAAQDSIKVKDSTITALKERRPLRTNHYDTIYFGIRYLNSVERERVLADRRNYLQSLRSRRTTITD
jgi:hypothetical protein